MADATFTPGKPYDQYQRRDAGEFAVLTEKDGKLIGWIDEGGDSFGTTWMADTGQWLNHDGGNDRDLIDKPQERFYVRGEHAGIHDAIKDRWYVHRRAEKELDRCDETWAGPIYKVRAQNICRALNALDAKEGT